MLCGSITERILGRQGAPEYDYDPGMLLFVPKQVYLMLQMLVLASSGWLTKMEIRRIGIQPWYGHRPSSITNPVNFM